MLKELHLGFAFAALSTVALAQEIRLPLQMDQNRILYNRQSFGGAPVSPAPGEGITSDATASPNQFQGFASFGTVVSVTAPGDDKLVLSLARAGSAFVGRPVAYLFGDVIPPPKVDGNGVALTETPPDEYWLAEPFTRNNHQGNGYYWSPHAARVFAIRPGPISVTWRSSETNSPPPLKLGTYNTVTAEIDVPKEATAVQGQSFEYRLHVSRPNADLTLEATSGLPAGFQIDGLAVTGTPQISGNAQIHLKLTDNGSGDTATATLTVSVVSGDTGQIVTQQPLGQEHSRLVVGDRVAIGHSYYALHEANPIVSSTPVKPPKKMYWTEGAFRAKGKAVQVPVGRVGALLFAYYERFPERVENEVTALGESKREGGLQETRTIWMDSDQGQIRAHNHQGRIFMEILGDKIGGTTHRQFLGFEVIDVFQSPNPADVTIHLGDRLTAFGDGQNDSHLIAAPINSGAFERPYVFERNNTDIFAIRKTVNRNDVLVHWLEEGIEGLRWPSHFVRYRLTWPADVSKYSHYIRPKAADKAEARKTAIPLPTSDVPQIDYQDPLDRPRAELTDKFEFYTYLTFQYPAHRTLLRFTRESEVRFERVFSWLSEYVQADPAILTVEGGLRESVASELDAWDDDRNAFGSTEGELFDFGQLNAPRVVRQSVSVGQRINAPAKAGEQLQVGGYIRQSEGTSFSVSAYVDPMAEGFEAASRGAIIPINAIPDTSPPKNELEVWWFRPNEIDASLNFEPILWPSVIGRYTIGWPAGAQEIILASDHGSGPLPSSKAKGGIYFQNDPARPGYNPNEEHALMLGGQAYALRDDLNLTGSTNYSSQPYVLLEYADQDGRPSIMPFKVIREKPEQGIVFNYAVEAGTPLQPPMPLRELPKPVIEKRSLNAEVGTNTVSASSIESTDTPAKWISTLTLTNPHRLIPHRKYVIQSTTFTNQRWLVVTAADYDRTAVTAVVTASDPAPVKLTEITTEHVSPGDRVYLVAPMFHWGAWTTIANNESGITFTFDQPRPEAIPVDADWMLVLPDTSQTNGQFNGWTVRGEPVPNIAAEYRSEYAKYTTEDRKNDRWVYRGPHRENEPGSFEMQYYYKTRPGFYFPTRKEQQPPVGTLTPYLRIQKSDGTYQGGDVEADPNSKQALPIAYSPRWPGNVPKMNMGRSLIGSADALPAIRGQTSLQVLYQQSLADETKANSSVVLHDPTREKEYFLGTNKLSKLPQSAQTQMYQGKVFFPRLPPHLSERFFFDPNRGEHGALVLSGRFVDEALGMDYLHLNALSARDVNTLKQLVIDTDADKSDWSAAIDGLSTRLVRYVESQEVPGTFVSDANWPLQVIGITEVAAIQDDDIAVDSYALAAAGPGTGYVTLIAGDGKAFTPEDEPVSILIVEVVPELYEGEIKVVQSSNPLNETLSLQQVADLAANTGNYEFDWRYAPPADGKHPGINKHLDDPGAAWLLLAKNESFPDGVRANWGGSADVKTLADHYLIMRYGLKDLQDVDADGDKNEVVRWSRWTDPALAEGWIKRVLAGINPFNQRITDLFNNQVNTDVSMLTQAGRRWEGDVALNLENINNYGLIEIYETVLRRGRSLSIDAGINFGPANDALLVAAGYVNDLYMLLGNEAFADAANPTIGIGTADRQFGDIATSLFSFKGQVASLLDEEMTLLRGRDDFLLPGVELSPLYNRLVWNYTGGIDSGEVIYANNYNIKEDPNKETDGVVSAADAAVMFPQGHGDAYGQFLTALKGYYFLLLDDDFDWVPRIEAISVLGTPVSVDYMDERKFAAAAAAVARTGNKIIDLTWRQNYQFGETANWQAFSESRHNDQSGRTRYWSLDHWATRTGQGSYLNWVVGNSILPDVDPDPSHEGIQKVDRTTVPELDEVRATGENIQITMDNAEGGMNPLRLPATSIPFDVDPFKVLSADKKSHFEQIFDRAKATLNNAVAAFDEAKGVTRLMRSEQESLDDLRAEVASQELAFQNKLIGLYGTPYPDDIGPGKTYDTGYDGPDFVHYMYVDHPEREFKGTESEPVQLSQTSFKVDIQQVPVQWSDALLENFDFIKKASAADYNEGQHFIAIEIDSKGFTGKPKNWKGHRKSPGKIQQAISEQVQAQQNLMNTLRSAIAAKGTLDQAIDLFNAAVTTNNEIRDLKEDLLKAEEALSAVNLAFSVFDLMADYLERTLEWAAEAAETTFPRSFIAGFSNGGDLTSGGRASIQVASHAALKSITLERIVSFATTRGLTFETEKDARWMQFNEILPKESAQERREAVMELQDLLGAVQDYLPEINQKLREYDDVQRGLRALLAEADRLQKEREIFRRRASALVQGFRTRDAAFRIFRNEKLERYKTLFDLAAQYAYLAAKAYDYDTGLLHTDQGKQFINRIVRARALGVVSDGEPQFAGSDTGDPGLSSVLAEMKADWDVLKGRLGFNNPDQYGTLFSLRQEHLRILPGPDGDTKWREFLAHSRRSDILQDADVRRYAMQVAREDGLPVPGLIIEFDTVVADDLNFFGELLSPGDHTFSPSSFATKIFSSGIALEGYIGMDSPALNAAAINRSGGVSPSDPSLAFLHPKALSATPFIYLIPTGLDSMRSPPLGDQSVVRTWQVDDVTIPLPFNIGASDFSTKKLFQSSESLTEPLFGIRKHQAFRPVPSGNVFTGAFAGNSIYQSPFTNRRLIGRSVWNSRWKLVIPGKTLLHDPKEGLDRFIQTVHDIKLYLETYSFSGN